jgi:hypothetical protein
VAPERIDWQSVHAVLLLDYVTQQTDRPHNTFFRALRGKFTAVAVDNEAALGYPANLEVRPSELARLLRTAAAGHPYLTGVTTLSPQLRRGLEIVDVAAWQGGLLELGIRRDELDAATRRLLDVRERGLEAIVGPLPVRAMPSDRPGGP